MADSEEDHSFIQTCSWLGWNGVRGGGGALNKKMWLILGWNVAMYRERADSGVEELSIKSVAGYGSAAGYTQRMWLVLGWNRQLNTHVVTSGV